MASSKPPQLHSPDSSMAAAFSIHLGTSTDIPALVGIENQLFDDSDGRLTARNFRYHLQAQNLLLVASTSPKNTAQVAGYLLLLINRKSTRLYSIGVLPQFQHQGIASALIAQAIAHSQFVCKQKMVLEVKVANQSAISLYQRMGFHGHKVVPGYYYDGSDALRMEQVF